MAEEKSQNLSSADYNGINKTSDSSHSLKTSPIRTPVTENDPLGALQSKDEINKTDETGTKTMDNKNKLNSSEVIGDHESSPRMKYDLLIGGLFSHYPSKTNKKDGETYNHKTKKRESEKFGQGDGNFVSASRVPKSATFHHSREKESKSKTVPRGSIGPPIDVNLNIIVYLYLYKQWFKLNNNINFVFFRKRISYVNLCRGRQLCPTRHLPQLFLLVRP